MKWEVRILKNKKFEIYIFNDEIPMEKNLLRVVANLPLIKSITPYKGEKQ